MVCIGEEGLARYLAGDLEYEAHQEAEEHIGQCAQCASLLSELTMRTEVRAVGGTDRLEVQAAISDKVMWLERHYGLQIGDVIAGKYEIEKVIGEGGMGIVVRATHLALRDKVALKFMHPSMASNPTHAARFIREARAAVRLREQHVARVLDMGEVDDTGPYIVMEYLEGQDLLAYLKRHAPLPVAESIELIRQGCSGVAAAHEANIVHRDLKPGNMFLTLKRDEKILKVLDFGVSKYLEGDSLAVTGTNMVVGSPMYMAPELFETARNATPASDVWALGVILYRMLSGRLPFFGESLPELVAKIHFGKPTPITHWRPELPREVCQILDACFQRDPRLRFANGREMLAAVKQLPAAVRSHEAAPTTRVAQFEPTPARAATATPAPAHASVDFAALPAPERKGRPLLFAFLGAVLASALFGGILMATSGDKEKDAPEPAATPAVTEAPIDATPNADPIETLTQPDAGAPEPVEVDAAPDPQADPVSAGRDRAKELERARLRKLRERRRARLERERKERERKERERKEREAKKETSKEPVLLIPDKKKKKPKADDEE